MMETVEHREAGNSIRIETLGNKYLKKGHCLDQKSLKDPEETLKVVIMSLEDDIPVDTGLELSAGDIVALAGDYYTKPGWGNDLQVFTNTGDPAKDNKQPITTPIAEKEFKAFQEAYADLATPVTDKQETINQIFEVADRKEDDVFKEIWYAEHIPGYADKLTNNVAHFAPWSTRAYIVGHSSALKMAELARECHARSDYQALPEYIQNNNGLPEKLAKIKANPTKYGFLKELTDKEIYTELGHRYHALAVAQDLFIMHFYSDHFAAGHLSRISTMRKTLPEKFPFLSLGSILINNMHNEDNTDSIEGINPFQEQENDDSTTFLMPNTVTNIYGDGTYANRENDDNANMLINGMDNSLGDIARLMTSTAPLPQAQKYGGLNFLPEIDYTKRQTQPLLIEGTGENKGKFYFRENVRVIKMLSPSEYQNTIKNPPENGYKELTTWEAFKLVIKLRVLPAISSIFTPKLEVITKDKEEHITANEEASKPFTNPFGELFSLAKHSTTPSEVSANVQNGITDKEDSSTNVTNEPDGDQPKSMTLNRG